MTTSDLVHDHWAAAMWADHQLGRDVLGTDDHIGAMKADDIAASSSITTVPTILYLRQRAALDHDELVDEINRRWTVRPAVRVRSGMRQARVWPGAKPSSATPIRHMS